MPIHDWTRVPPSDYHAFHLLWLAALAPALTHRLPAGYYATADPAARRLAVRHVLDRQLVAVVEVAPSCNKARRAEFADLVGRAVRWLRQGIHLLLIDPCPPTARDPSGVHDAVWYELAGKRFVPPAGRPLALAAYAARGGNTFFALVTPLAVGDRLPDMPLFLTGRVSVPAPLEDTYQAAWRGFPAPLRAVVEG